MIKDNKMFCNQESRVKISKTCLAGYRQASDCAAVQSDPRLCCKHPGEFVLFSMFLFVVIN